MDIDRFVEERKDRWRRLEEVLGRAESSTEQELGPEGMRELLRLYRLTSSDLNQARSLTADPELLERLNALAGRGYRFIYRSRREGGVLGRLRRFLGVEVPEAYRQEAWSVWYHTQFGPVEAPRLSPGPPAVFLKNAAADGPDVTITAATDRLLTENSISVHPLDSDVLYCANNSTDWDGTQVTGLVNPGFEHMALQNATLNPQDWTVHFEVESKDAAGKAVRCVVDGKIDKLGSDTRTLTGTWVCGTVKQNFKLTRDRDYYRGVGQ